MNRKVAGAKEIRIVPRSDTPPGERQVTARRQRYSSGRLEFWLDWFRQDVL